MPVRTKARPNRWTATLRSLRAKQRGRLQQSTRQAQLRIAEFSSFEMGGAGGGPLFFWGYGLGLGIQSPKIE